MTDVQLRSGPPPRYRIPVERRWLGLDRRSLGPGFFVLAMVILLAGVVPVIDSAISWNDPIKAGDVINMGGGVTFVPPIGWELTDGIRTNENPERPVSPNSATATLASKGVQVDVKSGAFAGTADDLVDQLNRNLTANQGSDFKTTGRPSSVTTADGHTGVTERYTSAAHDGQLAAFIIPAKATPDITTNIGLTFTVSGPAGSLNTVRDDIEAMLNSVAVAAAS